MPDRNIDRELVLAMRNDIDRITRLMESVRIESKEWFKEIKERSVSFDKSSKQLYKRRFKAKRVKI